MNPRDELIRRAMLHARHGYAVGGKPGESAMARAEATRGTSPSAGNVGGIRDGGFGGAGGGRLEGGGGGNAPSAGMMAGSAGRDGGGGRGPQQTSNVGAKGDFGFAGQPSPNLSAKGDFLGSGATDLSNYVAPSPDIGSLAFNRAIAAAYNDMPNLTGTSLPVGVLAGLQNPARPETINPSMVNFTTAATNYGTSLPIKNPKTLSDYLGSTPSASPSYGPIQQQVNRSLKEDFAGTPTDRLAQAFAGQTSPLASYMGSPAFSKAPATSMAATPASATLGAAPRSIVPSGFYNPVDPFADMMETTSYPAPSFEMYGRGVPPQASAPVDLTGLNANPPLEANRYLREPQNITGSGFALADSGAPVDLTGLNANPPLEANRYLREPQNIFGSTVNTADSGMPVDLTGLNANPPLEAPRYLREPQNITPSNYQLADRVVPMAGTNSFANSVANQSVVSPTADMPAPMNYVPMVPRPTTPPPANANFFQSVANAMLPENLFPMALYTQPTPPGQYLTLAPEDRGIFSGYMAEPFRIDRDIGVAKFPNGINNPTANVITTASGRQMAFNPALGRYEYVSKFRGSLDDRPGGDNREQNREYAQGRQNRKLLGLGYTQAEIDAMSPEKIKEVLAGNVAKAANGGRMGYAQGGKGRNRGESSSSSRESSAASTFYAGPDRLPDLPAYQPSTLPTYTMPQASPMISNFVNSMPQQSSMPMMAPPMNAGMPQQRPQYSPEQGYFNPFENLFGYNQYLSNMGRPMNSGGSVNGSNDSISNAMRIIRG